MTTSLLAADEPRLHACAIDNQSFPTSLPIFESDAQRYAWIVAEYRRRLRPGVNRARLARDLAAIAFETPIEQLVSASRKWPLAHVRQKIVCFTFLMTDVSWHALGALFNRDHATIIFACRKYAVEVEAMLGVAIVRPFHLHIIEKDQGGLK